MKKITLLIVLYIMAFSASSIEVEEITVKGLQNYTGQRVSLFYVSGTQSAFGTAGQELDTTKILLGPVTRKITQRDIVFPKVNVERDGFSVFNYLLAVIHKSEEHFLTNIKVEGEFVIRKPVSRAVRKIPDTPENRSFLAKKFKPIFKVRRDATIRFK